MVSTTSYHAIEDVEQVLHQEISCVNRLNSQMKQWWTEKEIVGQVAGTGFKGYVEIKSDGIRYSIFIPNSLVKGLNTGIQNLKTIGYIHCFALQSFANACAFGNLKEARRLRNQYPLMNIQHCTSKHKVDSRFYSPLVRACRDGRTPVVEFLLNAKADPNESLPSDHLNPLFVACFSNSSEKLNIIPLLLQSGANVNSNKVNPIINRLIHYQNLYKNLHNFTETAILLIKAGARITGPFFSPLYSPICISSKPTLTDLAVELEDDELVEHMALHGGKISPGRAFSNTLTRICYEQAILKREEEVRKQQSYKLTLILDINDSGTINKISIA